MQLEEQREKPAEKPQSLPLGLVAMIGLNMVPLAGVLYWGWQSFDLIFLYWMENLVIGAFTLARLIIRPYSHPIEMCFPLFFAPFFTVHYGMFCMGHGTFIVGLFGPDNLDGFDLLPTVITVLSSGTMLFALVALTFVQAMDWARDVHNRGFGADSLASLMFHPYRRIIVLHVTILAAGFALAALEEPLLGLIILVLVKTISDVWHWRKDEQIELPGKSGEKNAPFEWTPELLAEMQEKYPHPVVTVNGQEKKFASFADMLNSKELRFAKALMRLLGAGRELKALTAYLEMRVAEENAVPDSGTGSWAESREHSAV